MNILKALLHNKSVLKKYIVSYMMFAALICSVTGVAIFSVSAHELNQMAAEETGKRLQAIADNIDAQMDVMQEIAHEIASLPEYKLSYIEKHKFREVEMLDGLKKYISYTPLISRFFLLYRGRESAYLLPDKATSRFSAMAAAYLDAARGRRPKHFMRKFCRCGNGRWFALGTTICSSATRSATTICLTRRRL